MCLRLTGPLSPQSWQSGPSPSTPDTEVHPALSAGPQGRCCLSDGDLDSPLSPLLRLLSCPFPSWKVPAFRSAHPFSRERTGAGSPGTLSGVSCSELPAFSLAQAWPLEFSLLTYFWPLSCLYSNISVFRARSSACSSIQTASSHHMCVASVLTMERNQGRLGED